LKKWFKLKFYNFKRYLYFLSCYEIPDPDHILEYSIIEYNTEINEKEIKKNIIPCFQFNSYKNVFKYSDIVYKLTYNNLYELPFVKKYLRNKQVIQNILDNPKYITNLNLNTNIYEEYLLIKFTYIVSLIHNKYNSFIIKFLLHPCKLLGVYYVNNKLSYTDISEISSEKGDKVSNIFKILSRTPNKQFNNYIYPND